MTDKRMAEQAAFRSGINVDWDAIDDALKSGILTLGEIIAETANAYNIGPVTARHWVYSRMDKLDAEAQNELFRTNPRGK